MHPIERLRYVARAGDVDATLLAEEAADALAGLASEPRALVVAARRLIEFHPRCAPLWWVAARVLAADDGRAASRLAIAELEDDPTSDELAAALPGSATVVAGAEVVVAEALGQRRDLTVRLVGDANALRTLLRAQEWGDASGWLAHEAADALAGAQVLVVAVDAAGPQGCLVAGASASLVAAADGAGVPVWAVAGVGRVLPEAMFAALAGRAEPSELVHVEDLAVVVGPDGPENPAARLGRSDCPALAELTR